MTSLFSSPPVPPPIPTFFTDEVLILLPATSNERTSETTSSPSSFPSFLDPFNIFSSPPSASILPSSLPLPHSNINPPSHSYERRKNPSSSPGSAVLLLVGLTGGISLLASSSTFLLLRRSLADSVARKINQGTDRTLEEIRNSLSRVEGRLGAMEGRARSGKGGGRGGGGSDLVLLRDLKDEVRALRRDLEKNSGQMIGWSSGLREDGEGRAKVADVSSSDLRSRSPYDFVPPPPRSTFENSAVVDAPTVASPPPFAPTPVEPFAEQLITLDNQQTPDALTFTSVPDQVKVALENKRSKLEAQSARSWKQAFEKGPLNPPSPPLVRVKGSDKVWEDAFKTKQEDVDAMNAVEPAREVVPTESKEVESALTLSSSSLDQFEDDKAKKLWSNVLSSSDGLISSTSPSDQPSTISNRTFTSISTNDRETAINSPPIPPSSLDAPPPLESTPLSPPTTTLGKDLDLAASLASRIDAHWYSSTSSSHETSNIKTEAHVEEPPVVDQTKSRKTRARPSSTSNPDSIPPSSPPPSSSPNASTPSNAPASPTSAHHEQPAARNASFHFGAATTFFPPGIGFAGVYSSPPLRFLGGNPSSSKASSSAPGANAGSSEDKPTRGRTRGSKIVDVTLEGYDKNGALFRSFRRRFL